VIRRADLDSVAEISAIIREVAPLAFAGVGTPQQLCGWLDQHSRESTIIARVLDPGSTTMLAQNEDGRVVGTAYLMLHVEGENTDWYIGGLYCRVRGRGWGPGIILHLCKMAESLGAHRVSLSVAAKNNRMLGVVARLGFREVDCYLDREFFTDDTFLTLSSPLPLLGFTSPTADVNE
jgi:RimJ/RimL family protein N-acetyltransferase